MSESSSSARHVATSEHRLAAVALRIKGKSYDEIGTALGISRQAAFKLVKKAMEDSAKRTAESSDHLRAIELIRLDAMRKAIWDKVDIGDLSAIDRAIKISKRMSELSGIDAPITLKTPPGEALKVLIEYVQKGATDGRSPDPTP